MKPSDFTNFPMGSVANKCESETVAQNIMIILKITGDKFKKLSWKQYKQERSKDGDFSEGEKYFYDGVVNYCKSANAAKLFSPAWNKKATS